MTVVSIREISGLTGTKINSNFTRLDNFHP